MKKLCKSAVLMFLISMLLSTLTGCAAQDKLELLNAFEKTADIRSYENRSSFEIQKVTLQSTIEEAAIIEPFVDMLNGLKMDMDQKISQNNEKTALKAQIDMAVTILGTTEQTSMWMDYDSTKTPLRMKGIIKIPASAVGMIPGTDAGKEYLVMDESISEDTGVLTPDAYTESLESAQGFQSQLLNLIKQYAIDRDPNFVVVTQLPDRTINGEKHKVYQLKLTDSSLKSLLKYISAEIPQDEGTKEMIKEFILTMMMMTEGTEAGADLSDTFEKFRDGSTTFSQDLSKTLEALDDVKMLGSQGIVIDFWVNSQGYIVRQDGIIDLFMSTQQVDNALEKLSPSGNYPESNKSEFINATATLSLKFSSETSRINEAITIEFPALTPENSVNLNEIGDFDTGSAKTLKKQAGSKNTIAAPKSIQASSNAVKYDITPIIIGNHIVLPLEPVCKNLGITYKKNKDGSYSITYGKKTVRFSKGSNKITVNKASATLSLPVSIIENRLFVPQEFVERYLGGRIILNRNDKTAAVIRK
ncbi:MAG: hypothetical protein K0S75_1599 [Clostridia bacterium]|jgi:hypothetical protein|nr:hypothetical protein [Clostridia bacterium]